MLAWLRSRTTFSAALLVDGIATALAIAPLSAAIVFQTALEYASGEPLTVGSSRAYPITDLILIAVGVRRAGQHGPAAGPHLGPARGRHPAVLVRRLDVPRAHRGGHL